MNFHMVFCLFIRSKMLLISIRSLSCISINIGLSPSFSGVNPSNVPLPRSTDILFGRKRVVSDVKGFPIQLDERPPSTDILAMCI